VTSVTGCCARSRGGSPPRQMESAAEVIETIVNNKGAIGYIDKKKLSSRVKVVLELAQ